MPPVEFLLFGATLMAVALLHRRTLEAALTGLVAVTLYKLVFTGFKTGDGLAGLAAHLGHEWPTLANLLCLLLGFAILARHFEKSHAPVLLPRYLPDDWKGAFLMLTAVFFLSSFLDNIAAAMIGGALAHQLFRAKVHIGYLAAIVAAANAGGAWSVVGDTTTTMMWIAGVAPAQVIECFVACVVALVVFGVPAAIKQQAYSPILKDSHARVRLDWTRIFIVCAILASAAAVNLVVNATFKSAGQFFPFIGVAVWVAIFATAGLRRHDWETLPENFKGAAFLLSLVVIASMMPVERLPPASWGATLALGFVSAVFDNIPLTALALKQGGYDWGFLAYAVGFGGSMLWFGSSAGVALTNMYPEARSAVAWAREGWYVAVAYVVGFLLMVAVVGWRPDAAL